MKIEKKYFSRKKIFSLSFGFLLASVLMLSATNVSAATTEATYSFSGSVAPFGKVWYDMQHISGKKADYVKVNIKANNGDNYDLRLVYTSSFPSHRDTLAEKTGISAKGSNNTFYFIPQNGSCPGGNSSRCIRVPVKSGVSTSNDVIDSYDVLYGIEVHNGSWLGGTLSVSGTYSIMNY